MATRMDLDRDDEDVLRELRAPAHPSEVRESLAFWQERRRTTAWWRRRRRREAQAAIERCERELVAAERAHAGALTPARALALAGVRPAALRRRARRVLVVAGAAVTGGIAVGVAVLVEVLRSVFGG
jgi:hypothetical protein